MNLEDLKKYFNEIYVDGYPIYLTTEETLVKLLKELEDV